MLEEERRKMFLMESSEGFELDKLKAQNKGSKRD
jgi:hypothetical protein